MKGKWYPLWVLTVVKRAIANHIQVVAMWEPMSNGPMETGIKLDTRCSTGWAYMATILMGAVHS